MKIDVAGARARAWRDIVLIAGGLFLLYKGTREIHQDLEGGGREKATDD
jgi:hypothetical protein